MIRLFIGLPLPQALRDTLRTAQGGLHGARWVDPEDFHITLRFVGEIDENIAADLDEALRTLHLAPLGITLHGLGRFGSHGSGGGSRKGVRVLWAGVTPTPELSHLQSKIETTCRRVGLEPETGKFQPHVTLATFHPPGGPHVDTLVAANAIWPIGQYTADHFCLFRSHLGRTSPHYEVLAEYPLAATVIPAAAS